MAGRNDDGIAVDIFTRLMSLKRDIVLDELSSEKIKSQAANTIASYANKLMRYQEEMPDISPTLSAQERRLLAKENQHEQLLDDLNKQVNDIENQIEKYKHLRQQAQDNEDYQKAQYYDTKTNKAEADISQATSSVSLLAQQGQALNKKAEHADNYLDKAAYRLFAAPYDRLDDTICCFIKLLLRRIEINDMDALEAMEYADEMIGDLPISELKSAIDAIRGVLYLAYTDEQQLVSKFEDMIMSIIMAPVRAFVTATLDILKEIENEVLLQAQDFFDDWIHINTENPESVLDCVSFEGFADFVYDEVDNFFRDSEARIMDLYRLVEEQELALDKDSLELGKKDQIRQWYKVLTEMSKKLTKIENFSVTQSFGNWVQEFLYEFDMATTYNPQTGNFESIDMRDCIAPVPNDGSYRSFLPQDPNDLSSYNIDDMAEFADFLRNNIPGLDSPGTTDQDIPGTTAPESGTPAEPDTQDPADAPKDVPLSYRKPETESEDTPDRDSLTSTPDESPQEDLSSQPDHEEPLEEIDFSQDPAVELKPDQLINKIRNKLDGAENFVPEIDEFTNTEAPEHDTDDIDMFIDMYQPHSYDCELYFRTAEEEIKQGIIDNNDTLGAMNSQGQE